MKLAQCNAKTLQRPYSRGRVRSFVCRYRWLIDRSTYIGLRTALCQAIFLFVAPTDHVLQLHCKHIYCYVVNYTHLARATVSAAAAAQSCCIAASQTITCINWHSGKSAAVCTRHDRPPRSCDWLSSCPINCILIRRLVWHAGIVYLTDRPIDVLLTVSSAVCWTPLLTLDNRWPTQVTASRCDPIVRLIFELGDWLTKRSWKRKTKENKYVWPNSFVTSRWDQSIYKYFFR